RPPDAMEAPPYRSTFGVKTQVFTGADGLEVSRVSLPAHLELTDHSHRWSQICLVRQGTYCERVQSRTAALQPGSALFRPAQVMPSNRVGPEPIDAVLIEFQSGTLPALRQIAPPDEPIYTSPGTFADLAIDLQAELDCPDPFTPTVIATLVPLCAIRLLRLREERGHHPAWLHRALAIVRGQFTEKITSTGLAQQLGISQGQLARGFRRYKQRS